MGNRVSDWPILLYLYQEVGINIKGIRQKNYFTKTSLPSKSPYLNIL